MANINYQAGVDRNLRILHIKKWSPQERIASLTAQDRPALEATLRQFYGNQGLEPMEYTALINSDLQKIGEVGKWQ